MSLRENTYVILAAAALLALVLAIGATVYAGRVWVHSGERQVAMADVTSVGRVLADQESSLGRLAQSLATRSEIVSACHTDRAPAGDQRPSLESLGVDAVVVRSPRGTAVLTLASGSTTYSAGDRLLIPTLQDVGKKLAGDGVADATQAALSVAGSAYLVAACPVKLGATAGSARGVVLIARRLTPARLRQIGGIAGVPLRLRTVQAWEAPGSVLRDIRSPGSHGAAVSVQRPLDITVYLGLADFQHNYSVIVSSPVKPSNYALAMRTLGTLVGVLVAGGLTWAVAVFLAVDRIALSRMMRFRDAIADATDRANPRERIALDKQDVGDELTAMAGEINGLLDALESARLRAHDSEEKHRVLVESMPEAVFTTDPDGIITYWNAQGERLFGLRPEELDDQPLASLFEADSVRRVAQAIATIADGDVSQLNVGIRDQEGRYRPIEVSLSAVRDVEGEPISVTCIARDISERRAFEAQLQYVADHDHLTSLYNRRRFETEVSKYLAEARRHSSEGALLWCDLDGFKSVNDCLGHSAGDYVLVGFANLLAASSREADIAARLGGDEFAVLLPGASRREAIGAARRVRLGMRGAEFNPVEHPVSVSIGVALYPAHGLTVDDLLTCADEAMYQAKTAGKDKIFVFSPSDECSPGDGLDSRGLAGAV